MLEPIWVISVDIFRFWKASKHLNISKTMVLPMTNPCWKNRDMEPFKRPLLRNWIFDTSKERILWALNLRRESQRRTVARECWQSQQWVWGLRAKRVVKGQTFHWEREDFEWFWYKLVQTDADMLFKKAKACKKPIFICLSVWDRTSYAACQRTEHSRSCFIPTLTRQERRESRQNCWLPHCQ